MVGLIQKIQLTMNPTESDSEQGFRRSFIAKTALARVLSVFQICQTRALPPDGALVRHLNWSKGLILNVTVKYQTTYYYSNIAIKNK
jgi:hypothetical protein